MWFSISPSNGFFGNVLTTAPVAPSPYRTDAGPRNTSTRSTDQVSTGKVEVPMPMYMRLPSYNCITEPWPVKPRADNEVPPSPGVPVRLMPVAREIASCTLASPRSRICVPVRLSTLPGVCRAVRFRREPAVVGVLGSTRSSSTAVALTELAGRVRAWALLCRASRHSPDARYLFMGQSVFLEGCSPLMAASNDNAESVIS